jgi:hypothetical protein
MAVPDAAADPEPERRRGTNDNRVFSIAGSNPGRRKAKQ